MLRNYRQVSGKQLVLSRGWQASLLVSTHMFYHPQAKPPFVNWVWLLSWALSSDAFAFQFRQTFRSKEWSSTYRISGQCGSQAECGRNQESLYSCLDNQPRPKALSGLLSEADFSPCFSQELAGPLHCQHFIPGSVKVLMENRKSEQHKVPSKGWMSHSVLLQKGQVTGLPSLRR
jgi:hypothetical protein